MAEVTRLEADVIVVGGGGAGLSAALEAARSGARVALLEKNTYLGGTTRLSVGSVSACCTPHQRRNGIPDSPCEFFEDMGRFNEARSIISRDNTELRRLLAEESPHTFEWLLRAGLEFFGPMPEPPNRCSRMHNVLPNASAYVHVLTSLARRHGVRILTSTRVERLLGAGKRVEGVEAGAEGGCRLKAVARCGVILAAGDYSSSPEMKQAYLPAGSADVEGVNPTSTGDGQRMALDRGARLLNGDLCLGPEIRFVPPARKTLISSVPPLRPVARIMNVAARRLPSSLLRAVILSYLTTYLAPSPKLFEEGAILVNTQGQRFTNELDRPALDLPRQPDRVAFIVFDDRVARRFTQWPYYISTAPGIAYAFLPDYRRTRRDIFAVASTLDELAHRMGMPPSSLSETVAAYNRAVSVGGDAAFGRSAPGQALTAPPYYALGPAKSWIVVTDGGLAVTPRMEVLDEKGGVIPGLYAAGSTGQGGVLLEAHGLRLCWAFTSGRLAGRFAAAS